MSVVVIDHHQCGEELPEVDALVNPNRPDDMSGLGHLAAVGLVLVTLVAVNRELRQRGFWSAEMPEPDLLGMLHHVALGTVADVAPLTGLNRAFVAKGLIAMRRRDHVGHTALMDVSRLNGPPEAWHLGFMLGPRINAGGRIGRADLGVRLLLEGDVSEAARIAAELDRLNSERRLIEQAAEAQAEAEALASLGVEDKGAVIVTASEGWHPGVVGLVASRLKEKFSRPAFAIALEPGGIGTGSGRSISGVDLGKAVRQAVKDGLLMKGGGHAMAAGVTLRKERLAEFRAYLESALAADVANSRHENELFIDGAVSARAVTPDFARMLDRAGPFGAGNPEPVIALPSHQLVFADEVGQAHLRVALQVRRRRHRQRHRLPRDRAKARQRADAEPRPAIACRGIARGGSLAGHRACAIACERRRRARSGAGGDQVSQTEETSGAEMAGQVAGKVALVTGGASGIGEAVSELLAREGASVAVTDIDDLRGPELVARIKKAGGEAAFWHQDVTSEERWIEVVAEVVARYGRLDILVSNAGIGIGVPSITQMTLEDWRRQTAINLDGVFLSVKHCLPVMRKGGRGGSIVLMSSLAGLQGAAPLAGYCATKGGVRLFAKAVAMECASFGDGVRVNSVHPGIIDTPIWGKIPTGASGHGQNAPIDPEERAKLATPFGRAGHASEIAQGVLYLASDASSYVTGLELVIDGGMNAGRTLRLPDAPAHPMPAFAR